MTHSTRVVHQRESRDRAKLSVPFVGVDGEGGFSSTGRHEYLLLRAGGDVLETGHPLMWWECLGFLADLPPEPVYVGYFFDYDVTMICRDMPVHIVERLLDRPRRTRHNGGFTFPVDIPTDGKGIDQTRTTRCKIGRGFQIDYLPHKFFKVRRVVNGEPHPWVEVNDVGSFFQCSFVSALDTWGVGTEQQRELIREGKAQRAAFATVDDDMRYYNALEIALLSDLMTDFRQVCYEAGYMPTRWQGPGNLASVALRRHGIPHRSQLLRWELFRDPVFLDFCRAAYYGGRFERTHVGICEGPVWQADINSAYPAACLKLPCLEHGTWSRRKNRPKTRGGTWVANVHFKHESEQWLYGLPVRDKNAAISWPREGNGVYWGVEIEAAERAGATVHTDGDVYVYGTKCDCVPFAWVADLYDERKRIGKGAKGLTLKLLLNSIYGKLAQSIGSSPYGNPIYAGLITAITRATIIDLYAGMVPADQTPGWDVVMIATDGVFMKSPPPVAPDSLLGGWEVDVHPDGMFVIQPGLYFVGSLGKDGAEKKPKTRGVPQAAVTRLAWQFIEAWSHMLEDGKWRSVRVPVRNFTGLRLAHHRGKPETAGSWNEEIKHISFDWIPKRDPVLGVQRWGGWSAAAPPGGPLVFSVPYDRDIGRYLDDMRLVWADQPDWGDHLTENPETTIA